MKKETENFIWNWIIPSLLIFIASLSILIEIIIMKQLIT
jgi:hypothetical protein